MYYRFIATATELSETMDKALLCYFDNGAARYDGKECVESLSKLRMEKNATGPFKAGKTVTINIKSHVWKAVVVIRDYRALQKKGRKAAVTEIAAITVKVRRKEG